MRFIRVESVVSDGRHQGYLLDPDAYLAELPRIQGGLPDGARGFATDDDHYNFFGERCVKDLKLSRLNLVDRSDKVSLKIEFAPNQFKHNQMLLIEYVDVVEFSVNVAVEPRTKNVWPETRRLGDLQLDEILPHQKGCSHEIQMTGGLVWVVAADMIAEWRHLELSLDEEVINGDQHG